MLHDFHQKQTSEKPGSVHAVYLLDGIQIRSKQFNSNGQPGCAEETHMQSNPAMSSSMPQEENEESIIPTKGILLAREEELQGMSDLMSHVQSTPWKLD